MKLIGWIVAGVSAVTATTFGIVSLTRGGGDNPIVASASSDSRIQTLPAGRGVQTPAPITLKPKNKPKTIHEGLERYKKCRTYSTNCKSLLPIPEDSELYKFLN